VDSLRLSIKDNLAITWIRIILLIKSKWNTFLLQTLKIIIIFKIREITKLCLLQNDTQSKLYYKLHLRMNLHKSQNKIKIHYRDLKLTQIQLVMIIMIIRKILMHKLKVSYQLVNLECKQMKVKKRVIILDMAIIQTRKMVSFRVKFKNNNSNSNLNSYILT